MVTMIKLRNDAPDPPPVRLSNFWHDFGRPIIVGLICVAIMLLFIYRHDIMWKVFGKFPDIDISDFSETL